MSHVWTPKKERWLMLASAVLLVAAAFRLFALSDVPPGLAQDEILDADIASFILGGEHALFFRHGYGHEPLYHYWAAPFQLAFGDNVLSIRLPSVYLGLILIALTMRWARRDYGAIASLAAGVGLAISWWPIIFSRIGIRPILEPVLLVLAMWFWPLISKAFDRPTLKSAVIAGVWLGLSIYSYTAARIILLIPAMLLAGLTFQWLLTKRKDPLQRDRLEMLRAQMIVAVVVLVVGFAVYLPMALTLRADPTLQQRIDQLAGPISALRDGDIGPVWNATIATLGVFSFSGDPRWTYSVPHRSLFDPLTAVLFYFGLIVVLWRWRRPEYLILPIWLFVALLPSALSPDSPSTVRMIGALPVVFLLPGLAIDRLASVIQNDKSLRQGMKSRVVFILVGLFAVVIIINGYPTVRDGFWVWPQDSETRSRYQSVYQAIARHWLENGSDGSPIVADPFFEPIDAAGLRRNIGREVGARWIQSGEQVSGAIVWPGGITAEDGQAIYVPEYAPLNPSLMAITGISSEPLFRSEDVPSFAVYWLPPLLPNRFDSSDEKIVADRDAAEILALKDVSDLTTQPGSIQLATWWEILNPLPPDSAIFIHLLDSSDTIIAQFDGLDVAAETVLPGDVFLQRHILPLPDELLPGTYSLRAGVYSRGDGQRFVFPDNRESIELATCMVSEGESLIDCRLTEFD